MTWCESTNLDRGSQPRLATASKSAVSTIASELALRLLHRLELHDFQNAALHYEQFPQFKLPPKQWGWIAIRLSNIYSDKLNQPRTALELIRRLAAEHPETQAGGKALKRLTRISGAGLDPEAGKDL
ncbi:MAG: hypothetical protein ABMA26_01590 [Limisphaerales bacterium]